MFLPAPGRRALRAVVTLPLLPLLALAGPSPTARADGPTYLPADGPHEVTASYAYTGAPRSFTVPAGVTSVHVIAIGAPGGRARGAVEGEGTAAGGSGAWLEADVAVTPGAVLSVNVGGHGGDDGTLGGSGAAGWNGGGEGGAADSAGAGGGGATDLRTCAPAAADCDSLASRLVVAAGGGGAGSTYDAALPGGDAGSPGADVYGIRGPVVGGAPGTTAAGGAGGAAGDEFDRISAGGDGLLGVGGVGGGRTGPDRVSDPSFAYRGAGGGGGGLFGGGGGGDNRYYGASGGGGSSLVPDGGVVQVTESASEPHLTLTYDLGPVAAVTVAAAGARLPASGSATTTVSARATSAGGAGIDGLDLSFTSSDAGQVLGAVTDHGDGTYTATLRGSTTAGTATITATARGEVTDTSGTSSVVTDAYTAPRLTASAASATVPRAGWYRSPVTIAFACAGSRLSAVCPAPVRLAGNGRDQTVRRTIGDDQGRTSTAQRTVSIDRVPPRVRVTGATNGATYPRQRTLRCQGDDVLSGLASCRVTTTRRTARAGLVVAWTGTAVDRAGNTTRTTGRYTVRAPG